MPFTAESQRTQRNRLGFWAKLCALCASAINLLSLAGCGVQGEPLPPLLHVPERAEVQGVQRGERVLLSWAMPARTTEGEAVRREKLGPVEVYRAVLPGLRAEVSEQEFEAAAERVAALPALQIEYSEEAPASRAGATAAYAVRLLNRRGDSAGFSNIAAVPLLAALPAPGAIHLRATEQAILLEWPPVAGASSYHLYRAEGPTPGAGWELAAQTEQPRHADENFQYGREYRYLARAVAAQGAFRAESADSPVVSIRPEDVFPPRAPAHLTAVLGRADAPLVELSWEPNPEADLAGYNLFRSENGQPLGRLNTELLISPTFRDTAVRRGTSYSYAVSAVDRKGNESARSEVVQVQP